MTPGARSRPHSSLQGWGALVASLAIVGTLATVWERPARERAVLGGIVRVESQGLQAQQGLWRHGVSGLGALLHEGETFIASGPVLIALLGGGTLRIARDTRFEVLAANEVALHAGEMYVDVPPDLPRETAFIVRTSFGSIEHVGTQFDVIAADRNVSIRVREGEVRLRRGSATETALAGTELVVPPTGPASRRSIATHGRQWAWVERLEPEYALEDRKLIDFLQWVARETGCSLSFEDEHARALAEKTRLHGSVRGLPATQALETVLATTSLQSEFEADVIRVSSTR
jgi:ferric-dicitrate binding protein FerR (iron transport regulator)